MPTETRGNWLPTNRATAVSATTISVDYTAVLNVVFGFAAIAMVVGFLRSGGPKMMRMMADGGSGADAHSEHGE